jgi:hypothetical protein
VAAAVAAAQQQPASIAPAPAVTAAPVTRIRLSGKRLGSRVALWWRASGEAASFRVSVHAADGDRVLSATVSGRSATYALTGGSYRFTVAALDAAGRELAISAPWRVTVPRSRR